MSNITNLNRDYLIKINVKEATIDVPKMTFWNTDKKTSNMFVQLVINMSTNELISNYVTVQNATDYKITLNVIKPKTNQYKTIEATLLNEEKALFEIDLPDEYKDQVGNYNFEFEVSSKVDGNDESITTSNATYEVKGSILTNLNEETSSSPDLPILKQLIEQVKSLQGGDLTGYQKKSDNSLETTSKEVVGAINEVNSQYKDIANKKFEYPKLNWEKETLNLKYKYGDIRRYGAKCDGVTDDSDVFQWALDNCSPNGISVYIPEDKITVIAKSIVMKSNSTSNYCYKIKSNQYEINNFYILQKCKNLFVGENFYNNTPLFTQIKAIIKNVAIKVDDSVNHGTIFKAIKFISSQIEYNFFYHMYTVIEGSLGVGTKFNNNRIQSYEYSFLSSIATLGEHTFEDIKSIYNNANYNINLLNGLLVVSDENSSDFSRYSCQSNDSFLSNNYFSGAQTLTNIPEAVFAVESIDSDFIITNNWFEFGKYVISTLIRATNSGTSLIGTYFNNNIFQNFHRFFNPKSFYTSFSFNSNLFYNFNTSKIKTIFSNATDGDIDNFKSGVFISDINENNVPIYNNFSILDSYFELNNYSIYIDTGTTGKYKAFSICEQNSKFKDNDNLPYFRIKNTDDLLRNNFTCFNKYEKTMPECTNLYTTNSFIGRIVFAGDGIYIFSWNGTMGEYKKLTTN